MALFLATASLTFNLPSALRAPATPLHARRSATPLAYVGQDEEAGVILWNRTPGGMKFKETSKGSGEEVAELRKANEDLRKEVGRKMPPSLPSET